MSKHTERRLSNTNALLMGSGVGLAALESMFNMVNTQSLLAASMVRDHELSHPLQMQALAMALAHILVASENKGAVAIDIPERQKRPPDNANGFATSTTIDELKNMLNKNAGEKSSSSERTSTTALLEGSSSDKHLSEILNLLGDHLTELTKNYSDLSQNTMSVT